MRRLRTSVVIGGLVGAAVVLAHAASSWAADGGPLSAVDASVHDSIVRAWQPSQSQPGRDPRDFITIVAIDERTIAELGAYTGGYPRRLYAEAVDVLLAAPPRVIAFDLGFFEPTSDDALLAAAFDRARLLPVPTTIVLGSAGLEQPGQHPPIQPASDELTFAGGLLPVPLLRERAEVASTNLVSDGHGTVRSVPLLVQVGGVERPTLGLAALASYLRRPAWLDGHTPGRAELAGRVAPLEPAAALRVMYQGPPSAPYNPDSTYRVVSFVDVLRGRVDPRTWQGGLVFIGALGATGLADDYWTPTSNQGHKMAGVEIHANVAATLYAGHFLRPTEPPLDYVVILLVGVLAALVTAAFGGAMGAVATAGLLLLCAAADMWAIGQAGLLVPVTSPLVAGFLSFSAVTSYRVTTEQRNARLLRAEAHRNALRDRVTQLANRSGLEHFLAALLAGPGEGSGSAQGCALLLLDLDHFKDVNHVLGHGTGDAFLRQVAQRLREAAPSSALVARLSGGQFALALPGLTLDAASEFAEGLLGLFRTSVHLDGHEVVCSLRIGVADQTHGSDSRTLLRHAELAMYAAKHSAAGRATYRPEQEHQAAERLALLGGFTTAIEANQFVLYAQPKVGCWSGRLAGVEILVRWQHPELGFVPPTRFVPLAEESGIIRALTKWVLAAAVRQVRVWRQGGLVVPIAVNLSALDVQDPALPDYVSDLLSQADVTPELLTLEITESALLSAPERVLEVVNRLQARGIHIALDDFGTGYSSLGYLKRFDVDELKLDRSLVADVVRHPRDRAIVRSTIDLAHNLDMLVVAEGVEDHATLEVLRSFGCDLVQGYLLGEPMPVEEVPAWASRPDRLAAA